MDIHHSQNCSWGEGGGAAMALVSTGTRELTRVALGLRGAVRAAALWSSVHPDPPAHQLPLPICSRLCVSP